MGRMISITWPNIRLVKASPASWVLPGQVQDLLLLALTFSIACFGCQENHDELFCIHEDSEPDEDIGGDRGGQAAQVGRHEQRGRDGHQARGHQVDGGVLLS